MFAKRLICVFLAVAPGVFCAAAQADTVSVTVHNDSSTDYIVHVYDLFGNGKNEVAGSPFSLAADKVSDAFTLILGSDGTAKIEYDCQGGPSTTDITVNPDPNGPAKVDVCH